MNSWLRRKRATARSLGVTLSISSVTHRANTDRNLSQPVVQKYLTPLSIPRQRPRPLTQGKVLSLIIECCAPAHRPTFERRASHPKLLLHLHLLLLLLLMMVSPLLRVTWMVRLPGLPIGMISCAALSLELARLALRR